MPKPSKSKDGKSHYISVWMPAELHETIKVMAEAEARSVSNMIHILCKRGIKASDVPQQQ